MKRFFLCAFLLSSVSLSFTKEGSSKGDKEEFRSDLFLEQDLAREELVGFGIKKEPFISVHGPSEVSIGETLAVKLCLHIPTESNSKKQKRQKQQFTRDASSVAESLKEKIQKIDEDPFPYRFKLTQAPPGAVLHPITGALKWMPDESHTLNKYAFVVVAVSTRDPHFFVSKTFKVKLVRPLDFFGYSYFKPSQESIQLQRLAKSKRQELSNAHKKARNKSNASDARRELAKKQRDDTDITDIKDEDWEKEKDEEVVVRIGKQKSSRMDQENKKQPVDFLSVPGSWDATRYFVGPEQVLGANISMAPTDRYQVGPGDILHIKYWSPVVEAHEVDIQVDSKGAISVPVTNKYVVVRGQTLQQLEALLRAELAKGMRNPQISVNLKELRSIKVTVAGASFAPGSYHVPSVTTLFNILYASGGPSQNGSLRNIQLKRPNGKTIVFDFYKFLLSGDRSQDMTLEPGDMIFIPPAGARVTVKGEVKQPAIYELKEGETVHQAVFYAGGVKASGVAQRVCVASTKPGVAKRLLDIDLTKGENGKEKAALYDGDVVEILSVRPLFANAVYIRGAVDQPSKYELTENMTVADLVERARGLIDEAHCERADLFRMNPDGTKALVQIHLTKALQRDPAHNIPLKKEDSLMVYTEKQARWLGYRYVEVKGAVMNQGRLYRADNMRLKDALIQSAGLQPEAFMDQAFVQRYNDNGTVGELLKVDLKRVLAEDAEHNILLKDRDVIKIQTLKEASFVPEQMVKVVGAVQKPGMYPRSSNMRIKDLIEVAGGLLPNAAKNAEIASAWVPAGTPPKIVDIERAVKESSVDNLLLREGDVVTIPTDATIQATPRMITVAGAVRRPGTYVLESEDETLSSIIKRAGGLLEDAFPQGAQLARDPEYLKTDAQKLLNPRIEEVMKIVQTGEYERLVAIAELRKLQLVGKAEMNPRTGTLLNNLRLLGPEDIQALATSAMSSKKAPDSQKGDKASQELILSKVNEMVEKQVQNSTSGKSDGGSLLPVTPARSLKASELSPVGYINIDMIAALKHPGGYEDIRMREGDLVLIPKKPATISIVGAVVLPSAVIYQPRKTIAYYVQKAGGFTEDAAIHRMIVVKPYGTAIRASRNTILELGDTVYVPTSVIAKRFSERDLLSEIQSTLIQLANTVATVAILRSLSGCCGY